MTGSHEVSGSIPLISTIQKALRLLRSQGFFVIPPVSSNCTSPIYSGIILESVWNGFFEVRFIGLEHAFFHSNFRTFYCIFNFLRKIFSCNFKAYLHFLKIFFKILRTFSEFSVFSGFKTSVLEWPAAFLKNQKWAENIPHAGVRVWDQLSFFDLRRSLPSGSSSRTFTAPQTPCGLVTATLPPGGTRMSAATRSVLRVEWA